METAKIKGAHKLLVVDTNMVSIESILGIDVLGSQEDIQDAVNTEMAIGYSATVKMINETYSNPNELAYAFFWLGKVAYAMGATDMLL